MSAILRALRTLPIFVVSGKTRFNEFHPDAAVPVQDTGTLNGSTNVGGALGVTQISDVTGLVAWKDYIPVQEEAGRTVPYSYDANGYFPIRLAGETPIFSSGMSASLLHFDGADQSATFTDESGKTWSRVTGGGAVIQTAHVKFGTAALVTDNVVRCIETADHADFAFGSSDFTIAMWIKPAQIPGAGFASLIYKGEFGDYTPFGILLLPGGIVNYLCSMDGTSFSVNLTSTAAIALDSQYHHIEFGRNGNNFYAFLDGNLEASTSVAGSLVVNAKTVVAGGLPAGDTTHNFVGYTDELIIRTGECLHTASFTPPSAPYA